MPSPSAHPLSETLLIGGLLTFCGGFIDVYTYFSRGGVFAFGQTGNLIFFSAALAEGRWLHALYILLPILSFIAGVFAAEAFRHHFGFHKNIHWQQVILLVEALILAFAAFTPQSWNPGVIIAFAFASALQTESFRKIKGQAVATTMCTGNMRSATELLYLFASHGNKDQGKQSLHLYLIITIFALGALFGSLASRILGDKSILLGSVGLAGIALFFGKTPKAGPC